MKFLKEVVIATGLVVLLAHMPASAFDGAILKGIEINSPDNQSYKIIVKTDKDVPIKKYITAANRIVLDLDNTRPAQFVNTVYNNASEIDHIIVQPVLGNKLRIFLQGMNIAAGTVILDTRDDALALIKEAAIPEPVIAAPPVTSGTASGPIFIDLSDKTVDKVKSVVPASSYNQENIVKVSENNYFDWILRILMLCVIIIGGIKMFSRPKKVKIDLSSENMKNKEIDLLKEMEARRELITRSLGAPAAKKSVNSSVTQYGIKEYQNSQLPPRKMTAPTPQRTEKPLIKPKAQVQSKIKPVSTTKTTQKQAEQAKVNLDSTKFLETMAAIYQKSGRDDLASGIKQNLLKKQQTAG